MIVCTDYFFAVDGYVNQFICLVFKSSDYLLESNISAFLIIRIHVVPCGGLVCYVSIIHRFKRPNQLILASFAPANVPRKSLVSA